MKKISIIFIAILIFLFACEKKLDIDLPEGDKHIVVNSLIKPDSLISLHVSKSQSVLDANEEPILLSDAIVRLYRDNVFLEDLTYQVSGRFISTIYPETGHQYQIDVESAGLLSVNAETKLIAPSEIISLDTTIEYQIYDYEIDGFITQDTVIVMHLGIELNDTDKANNFYFLSISTLDIIYDQFFEILDSSEYYNYFESNNPVFRADNHFTLDGISGSAFTDELFNGNNYKLDISTYISSNVFFDNPEEILFSKTVKLYVKLLTISEDIYKYLTSYNLNQQSQFDPFSQPVQIYSNIENGLGLFSGYTMNIDSLELDF